MVTADPSSLNELVAMGFPLHQAQEALEVCHNDQEQAINWIFSRGETSVVEYGVNQDDEINKVIAISMQETSSSSVYSFDPISPEDRVRTPGMPVGMKNVGNTCYFNSLLQAYFMIPEFVKEILTFKEPVVRSQDNSQQARLQSASLKLVKQLQRLFSMMIRSHRRYIDPSSVLNALVDDFGNQLMIGDQKDVGEFNMVLVSRIEDGLKPIKPEEEDKSAEDNPNFSNREEERPEIQLMRKGSLNYTITVPDEGVISSLFYGRQVELLTSAEADGAKLFQHQEAVFGQVMLDVDERDIYNAWDKSCFSVIEDYVTPLNYKTGAEQEVWLTRLPKVLLFQIQRVCYDKEFQSSIKKHTVFNIEKVLYPDRFMHHNRAIGSILRKQAQELKSKIAVLESTLGMYERYASDNLNLEKVLRNASLFVGEQIDLQNLEEDDLMHSDYTQEQFAETQRILNAYADEVSIKVLSIKAELADLQSAIKALFDRDDLKQHAYNLHSILVHDGMAGSGHYYAYIYDSEHNRWRKYSDITVTDVSEEEVIERSIGGYSMTSAYCLMYVAASLDYNERGQVYRSFSFIEDPELIPDIYSSYLPIDLRREVDDDNLKLKRELDDFKLNQVIKLIQDTYVARFMAATAQCTSYRILNPQDLEANKFLMMNLAIYLKIKYEERLSRYVILNQIFREILQQSIEEIDKSGPLYQKIVTKLIKSHKDMPYSLDLNPYEVQRLLKCQQEFVANLKDATYNMVLLKSFLAEDFRQTYAIIKAELKRNIIEINFFHKPPKEIAKVGALFLMTAVSAHVNTGNIEKALEYASVLIPWLLDLFNTFDIIFKQVTMSFRNSAKLVARSSSPLKDEFEFKCRALESYSNVRTVENLPQEYLEVMHLIENIDVNAWVEGWRADCLPTQYFDLGRAARLKYAAWYELNTKLTSIRRLLTEREIAEFEISTAQLHLN